MAKQRMKHRERVIVSSIALVLIVAGIAFFYFGNRYEWNQFTPEAQQVLSKTGESIFIGLKWTAIAAASLVWGIMTGAFALADWINWVQTRH